MSTVTEQVRAHVESKPGVHFNALASDLGIATGQAQYHLRKLRRAGDVVAEEIQGKTHYYGREYDPGSGACSRFARRETARTILLHLLDAESLSADELADRLGVARSTVSWHVSALTDAEILEKSYGKRGRVVVALTDPDETRRLLAAVRPSLTDRLIDRFTRLVDDGLAATTDDS